MENLQQTQKVEIISIGDELLNGMGVNTNATWMCSRVVASGGRVVAITTVGDQLEEIVAALGNAATRATLVLVTGGLGPTSDDRTKDATIRFFGGKLIPVEEEIERIRLMFAERGLPLTELNIAQGWIPDTAIVLTNQVGTAPGMEFSKKGVTYVFLPGVPAEMKQLVTDNMHRWFSCEETDAAFVSSDITTVGIGESFVAEQLSDWENGLPDWLSLAYLPSASLVRIRLSCTHTHPEEAIITIKKLLKEAADHFPHHAFLTHGSSFEQFFFDSLKNHKLTLATAESCTGGYLAHRITSLPGSSAIFRGSIVAYHNKIKTSLLNVDNKLLETHGAVSREVVIAMAREVRHALGADIGIAISGIAGPDGGTREKPVGTVWIAVAYNDKTNAEKFLMGSHRGRNIEKSAIMAMWMVLKEQVRCDTES